MKLSIGPTQARQRELDMTRRLVSAIAAEIWNLYGGNDRLNWVEAETHLQRIVGEARAEARGTGAGAASSRRAGSNRARHDRAVAVAC